MIATDIIDITRKKLKEFITFEAEKVYLAEHNGEMPDFSNDEEVKVDLRNIYGFGIETAVSTVYAPDGHISKEMTFIVSVSVALDGMIYFKDVDDNDYTDGNLSTDELAAVSDRLEEKYISLVNSR